MENNKVNKSNKIKIIVLTFLILLVSVAGISYAYFTIQITGNDTASSMRLRTANMSLVYNDVQIVSGEYITPGWSETKTLTVTNNGNVTVYYTIIWRDLYNEITNDELVISATCSSTSETCPTISETVVPTTTPEGHNINVKQNIEIPVGVTHTYTLTVEFKETGSNQNYNQNKEFYGTLNIGEYEPPFKSAGIDSTTGFPVVRIGTEEFYIISDTSNGGINYSSLDSTFLTKINYDSSKSILLAKYNLYVGRNCEEYNVCTIISSSASEYGLQSVDAKGYVSENSMIAVVPFSGLSSHYWDPSNSGINSTYGTYANNANNIYDTNYVTAPNYYAMSANYSIAYYVEEYVDRLGVEGTGRLLTYPEANAMTQAQRTNGAWYWLNTASSAYNVWAVRANGTMASLSFIEADQSSGVRPVIVVDTSDISS